MARIRIMFSRFSAFYSPLIAAQAAGFLKAKGLEAEFAVADRGRSPQAGLRDGSLDLIQSAVSASFPALERGETLDFVHFAQINQRDGFFIAGRSPPPGFAWSGLAGARALLDHGTLSCEYSVGTGLKFVIAGIGQQDTAVAFMKSSSDGDFYASFGLLHGCVIVQRGKRSLEHDDPMKPGGFADYAFVSPKNGKVYKRWDQCKAAW